MSSPPPSASRTTDVLRAALSIWQSKAWMRRERQVISATPLTGRQDSAGPPTDSTRSLVRQMCPTPQAGQKPEYSRWMRLQAAELVPRNLSLPGISSRGTGRAHQWLGAGPVAAVWPACLSLPSILPIMAHDTMLSSRNDTDSPLRGLLLVSAVTATMCGTKRVDIPPVSWVGWLAPIDPSPAARAGGSL
jgi:hypothetical protein